MYIVSDLSVTVKAKLHTCVIHEEFIEFKPFNKDRFLILGNKISSYFISS